MSEPGTPLNGRRALVLGAGAPAGAATARALAAAGADVAVAAVSLDGAEVMAVRRVRRAVESLGRRSAEYAFDVTLGANVQVSTRQVSKDLGGLDILVYAVDAPLAKPAQTTTDAEWARVLAANLSGALYACRAAAREMSGGDWGRIALIVPEPAAGTAEPGAAYLAARAGLSGLAHGLHAELAGANIAVSMLLPDTLAEAAGVRAEASGVGTRIGNAPPAGPDLIAEMVLTLMLLKPAPGDPPLIRGYPAAIGRAGAG